MTFQLYPVLPCNSDTKNTLTSTLLHTVFFLVQRYAWALKEGSQDSTELNKGKATHQDINTHMHATPQG